MSQNKRASHYQNKTIWIIGASSGIGAALAVKLAGLGARIILSARREATLQDIKSTLPASGDNAHRVLPLDIANRQSVSDAAEQLQGTHIDSVIAMAGSYEPMALAELDMERVDQIIDINLKGFLYIIAAILPIMRAQKSGQIALCASVAGYRGLPNSQPYGATKAALINLTESLAIETKHLGLDVRLINPGFVKTPMTDKNQFKMPMIITPEEAADSIIDGLVKKGFEIHFPKKFTRLMKCLRSLPMPLFEAAMRNMVKK